MSDDVGGKKGASSPSDKGHRDYHRFLSETDAARQSDEFKLAVDEPDLKIRYNLKKNVVSIMYEGLMEADIVTMSAVAREWDLVKEWNGMLVKSDIQRIVSDLELLVSGEIWMPWPFRNRSIALRTKCIDATDSKLRPCVYVKIETDAQLLKTLKTDTSGITLYGGIALVPVISDVGKKVDGDAKGRHNRRIRSRALFLAHLTENRVRSVPSWLLNAGLKMYSPRVFKALNKMVLRIDDAIEEVRAKWYDESSEGDGGGDREASASKSMDDEPRSDETTNASHAKYDELSARFIRRIRGNKSLYGEFIFARQCKLLKAGDKEEASGKPTSE